MGKGRDKKKKLKNSQEAQLNKSAKEQKQSKKSLKSKLKKQDPSEQIEDIDQILRDFQSQQQSQFIITQQSNSPPPSRRANASFFINPLNPLELIIFGGEYFDGQKVHMYNDLLRYNIEKLEWKRITCPNSPPPRSSHQLIPMPTGRCFLFGGEFVSPNETSFFHYKDFWSFDLKSNQWEKLEIKKKPSPRSGHRMAVYKHYIVLFGGFYDSNAETKYYDDLWLFDTIEYTWTQLQLLDPKPTARSGFQLLTTGDNIILHGGYFKQYQKGKKAVGKMYQDTWCLKMSLELKDIKWERKKKAGGILPSLRSGCTMQYYKQRGIMFGGVSDIEESDEKIESICHNDAYQYLIDSNKWYPLNVREPTKKQKQNANNNQKIQSEEEQGQLENENQCVSMEQKVPCPRFNCMMSISKNILYIYGGILEQGPKEITLNDLWSINLEKMQEWTNIISDDYSTAQWLGDPSDDEDSEDEDSDYSQDEEQDSEKENDEPEEIIYDPNDSSDTESEESVFLSTIAVDDPHPGETLKDYHARTSEQWQLRALELIELEDRILGSVKVLRRDAFELSQERYNLLLPELQKMKKAMDDEEAELIIKSKQENSINSRHRDR